jgi:group I intron endonuclease
MGFIYKIKNKINGKLYIGQSSKKYLSTRWCNHKLDMLKSEKPLYRSMRKYGIENFEIKIIINNIKLEKLDYYECLWIEKLKTLTPNGYNISKGGKVLRGPDNPMFGKIPWNKNKKRSKETIEKIKASFTPEKLKKMRNRMLGSNNPMFGKTGEKSPMFGKKLSEDSLKRMKKNQPNNKPVKIIELNKSFISLGEVTDFIRKNTKYKKADYTTIRKSIKNGWKCYGYRFEFILQDSL